MDAWIEHGLKGLIALEAMRIIRDGVKGFFAWQKARAAKRDGGAPTAGSDSTAIAAAQLREDIREDRLFEKLSDILAGVQGNLKELVRASSRIEFKIDERNRRQAN